MESGNATEQGSQVPAEPDLPDPLTDGDVDHLEAAAELNLPVTVLIRVGLFLVRRLLETAPRPWAMTGSNDFAAVACFARAYRQLRAATFVAYGGYYSEVPTVLRGAYESASVARYLAHEPEKADRWITKLAWYPKNTEGWIPDREVREWFGDTDERSYAAIYGFLSKGTHPTAASCVPLLDADEERYSIRFPSVLNPVDLEESLFEILGVTLWVCFALRNAAPDERVIPPDWRQALAEYANDVGTLIQDHTGEKPDFSHLQRNWEHEYQEWEAFLEKVANAETLDELLQNDPSSWQNLKPAREEGNA